MKAMISWMTILALIALDGAVRAEPVTLQLPFSTSVPLMAGTTHNFTFSLFDSKTGGEEVWREEKSYRIPSSKTISHMLGSVVPFSDGMSRYQPNPVIPVNFTEQLWVEVKTGGFTRRVKLSAVPYAINSFSTSALGSGLRIVQHDTSPNVIGGHPANGTAPDVYGASIAGGGEAANANQVLGSFGAIGGGFGNQAGAKAVVGGGSRNLATGEDASVCGGIDNQASGIESSILGGAGGRATGDGSVIAGGCSNTAAGYRGFAAGEDAHASRRGMFVWSATDDLDPDGGSDAHYSHVYESCGGFPQSFLDVPECTTSPNPLLKDMQFWVKAPGGVFFVTGQDSDGKPLGVMLAKGSQVWEQLTPSPNMASNGGNHQKSAAASEAQVQALVADLEKRVAALEGELAAGRAESAAMKARIEDLALRHAELRRLLAGEPRHGSELAGAEKSRVTHP